MRKWFQLTELVSSGIRNVNLGRSSFQRLSRKEATEGMLSEKQSGLILNWLP